MPFTPAGLQNIKGFGRTAHTGATHGEFRNHNRQAQKQQEA